jgi:RNA polymerase sigma-70 factor (ECF subfamily)
MSDNTQKLIERVKSGDRDALEDLFALYRDRIHGLVRHKLGHGLRASLESSDVVQSVCLEAMKAIEGLEYKNEDGFLHWLARITENTIRDKHRYFGAQKRKNPEVDPDSPIVTVSQAEGLGQTPSRAVGNVEQMELVLRALRQLPPDYAEIIRLTRFEKKSHQEAAEVMGKSEKAARMLLARARARLLKEMETIIHDPGS